MSPWSVLQKRILWCDGLLVPVHPASNGDEEELELRGHGVEHPSKVLAAQPSIWSRLSFLVLQGWQRRCGNSRTESRFSGLLPGLRSEPLGPPISRSDCVDGKRPAHNCGAVAENHGLLRRKGACRAIAMRPRHPERPPSKKTILESSA